MCVAILEGIGPITAYGTIHRDNARWISHIQFLCVQSKNKKGLSRNSNSRETVAKKWFFVCADHALHPLYSLPI